MPRGTSRYDEARHQGRLWTPALLRGSADLKAWYDAADYSTITIGTNVSQWNDKSGFGLHGTQATGANQPVYTPELSVNFGATSKSLGVSGMPTQFDCSACWSYVPASGYWRVLIGISSGGYVMMKESGSQRFGCHVGSFFTSGYTVPDATRTIARMQVNGSRQVAIGVNGAALSANLATIGAGFAVTMLGNHPGDLNMWAGSMNELVFTNNLDQIKRDKIDGYLAWKWDRLGRANSIVANLPASHPFKNRPPLIGD